MRKLRYSILFISSLGLCAFVAPKKLNLEQSMEVSFFALCPWPRPDLKEMNLYD